MSSNETIRAGVSEAYAQALATSSCCSSSCCGAEPKGSAAKLAGYDAAELAGLPEDAVVNSFGCGNPLAFSEVAPGQTVVDLGSGAGIDILIAANKVGPTGHVIGVDMTDAMIERARANIAASGLANVEVRQGLIEALPIEDASVDWVISNCVINLSPEKPRVFAEIARVLKSGGRMQVSDIVAEELPEWMAQNPAFYSHCLSGAVSEAAYLDGLREAGLVEASVRERIVYNEAQLREFIDSECEWAEPILAKTVGKTWQQVLDEGTRALVGKVWSAKIAARKA